MSESTIGVKPMHVLLLGVLFMHLGNYMVIPLLPIYLSMEKALGMAEIGLVLAVTPFAFQAGSLLGGWLADRFGRRFIISLGAGIQAVALLGYVAFDRLALFVLVSAVSGLGIGLNALAVKAAIAVLAEGGTENTKAFSMRGVAANIGIAAAGAFTYLVLGGPSPLIFYTASALFAVLAVMSRLMLPAGCGDEPCRSSPLVSYMQVFRNKAFVSFAIVSFFVWALYTQLSFSLPLKGERVLDDPGAVSLIWTMNSLVVIALQTLITRKVIVRLHPLFVMAAGVLFFGGGLCLLGYAAGFAGLMLCGVIFIIGEMLVMPTIDSVTSRLGTVQTVGVYFGSANVIFGLGESSGKYAGGQLLEAGIGTAVPWLVYAIAAVLLAVLLTALRYYKPLNQALSGVSDEPRKPQGEGWANIRSDQYPWGKKRAKDP